MHSGGNKEAFPYTAIKSNDIMDFQATLIFYFCFSVTELLPCNQDEHIEEQEMSNRCQNNDEREANLVSLLQNAITDSVIIDVTVDRIQSDKTFDSILAFFKSE